jgi:hypothetical protein
VLVKQLVNKQTINLLHGQMLKVQGVCTKQIVMNPIQVVSNRCELQKKRNEIGRYKYEEKLCIKSK